VFIGQPAEALAVSASVVNFIKISVARDLFPSEVVRQGSEDPLSFYAHLITLAQIDERARLFIAFAIV
jgi:hypothetical protein